MKTVLRLVFIFCFFQMQAQVGINTTAPDAQLDIKASSQTSPTNKDGLLIPRVDDFPATNPTAAQQGMMVYLMVTSGVNPPGLYYWDNLTTSWIGISSTANGDKDWYKAGTTLTPSNTDDMYHMANVGIGLANPLSKLHVKNSDSGLTPNSTAVATIESSNGTYFNLLSGGESGVLFGANSNATNGGIIYNPSGLANSMLLRTNGNVNRVVIGPTGKVALGNYVPTVQLEFDNVHGEKICLFGQTGSMYGFGIQSSLLQMYTPAVNNDIAFGYGTTDALTERMRIKGTGNVGIGTPTPSTRLHVKYNDSGMTPNASALLTVENNDNTFLHLLSPTDSGILFGSDSVSTDGGIIYGSPTYPKSMALRTNGNVNRMIISDTGNVALGNFTPQFPLHFNDGYGDKVSLWGSTISNHYGFGIQNMLLQIHADYDFSDIAFGYGNSSAFTERMRIKGTGNVGIGTSTPSSRLHVQNGSSAITANGSAMITAETSGTNAYVNVLSTQETGVLFGASGASNNGGVIYNSPTYPNSLLLRTGGNTNRMVIGSTGNVAIGNFTPDYPLHFPSSVGDKISLWGSAGAHYGFGIQGFLMQIHSAGVSDDIAFGYGSSATFTETMRVKGSGEVGIGTSTPTAELEVNGFTKMGTTAPAVKMIKLTGTTSNTQGGFVQLVHGLTSSKILSASVLVEYSTGNSVPPSYTGSAGYEYDYYISSTSVVVWNKTANSGSILSKPIRVLVTYEE